MTIFLFRTDILLNFQIGTFSAKPQSIKIIIERIMEISQISSYQDLQSRLVENSKSYLLLYKSGSEQSDCAYREFAKAATDIKDIQLFAADVSKVRDIHENYHVTSAPTMLEFEGRSAKNTIKGCHESSYFKSLLQDAVYFSTTGGKEGTTQKRVVVYSTPTCTWCNTLKSYLREHKVRFTDIDVSRDQKAAQEMVNRSGQQGVPQTDINGQVIVGFDKVRINTLLGINE